MTTQPTFPPPPYVCPDPACRGVSWNRTDVIEGYCGRCHRYGADIMAAYLATGYRIAHEIEGHAELERVRRNIRILKEHAEHLAHSLQPRLFAD